MSWQGELYQGLVSGETVQVIEPLLAEHDGLDIITVEVIVNCSCINKLEMGFPFQPSIHALNSISNTVESGVCPHAQQLKQSAEQDQSGLKTCLLTALYIASAHGHSHLVEYLLRKGSDKDFSTTTRQRTPLHVAAMGFNEEGGTECARLLVENGADVNAKDFHGYTPLMHATKSKHHRIVELLIKGNCDVNLKSSSQETALYMGTLVGAVDCVKTLLKANADSNLKNGEDFSPLFMAVRRSSVEMVEALINSPGGCDVNLYHSERHRTTPLLLATYHGNVDIVKLLLDAGADPNLCNPDVITPLIAAAFANHIEITRHLLDRGADVNRVNQQGYAAIHHAAWEGYLEIVDMLLEAGSTTDERTNDKNTPLSLACHGNHFEVAERFVFLNCNVNNIDKDRDTPLLYTTFNGCYQSSELLVRHGADPDHENTVCCTPLWNAVYSDSPQILELLLKANVRISVPSVGIDQHAQVEDMTAIYNEDKTPLFVACSRGLFTVAKILVLAGTDLQQERWLRQSPLPPAVTDDEPFHDWITQKFINPAPLKGQCRAVIRNLARGQALVDGAPHFGLPTTLLNYLLLNELL